ncbi:MAG: site-specific integrase [Cyanobacteriota bacterium]|nr:site-specific integrase [Cyanobacteriota bacterium]
MKIDRHGRAKILTPEEIRLLFYEGARTVRDRTLFAVMLYTACRVAETVTLRTKDTYDRLGRVRPNLIVRKGNTKGKLATRTIPVLEDLRGFLEAYTPHPRCTYLFPGRDGKRHLHPDTASWVVRTACERIGLEGVSTHSFRRTSLSLMSNAGIPLRVIQEVSGHRTLDELYKYLEVPPEQVRGAIAALSILTPVEESDSEKPSFPEMEENGSVPQID